MRKLHLRPSNITVVPPGIDPSFSPGGTRSTRRRSCVAVGRLVPVKRFDVLDRRARRRQGAASPTLRAVIVGEGYEREALEAQVAELGAERLDLAARPGRRRHARSTSTAGRGCSRARRAHEGWGMTITEAAACGTPAVATRIAGHTDAIVDGAPACSSTTPAQLAAAIERSRRRRRVPRRCSPRTRSSTRRSSRGPQPRAARSRCSPPRRSGAAGREQHAERPADRPSRTDAARPPDVGARLHAARAARVRARRC